MNKRTAEGQFLFHSTGQSAGFPVFKRFNLDINIFDEMIVFIDCCIENTGKEIQVFFHRQILIQREFSGHITQNPAYFFIILHHVESFNCSGAGIGQQNSRQHSENGGFSCTIWTDKPKNFSRIHIKTHVIHCKNFFIFLAVAFSEVTDDDGYHCEWIILVLSFLPQKWQKW